MGAGKNNWAITKDRPVIKKLSEEMSKDRKRSKKDTRRNSNFGLKERGKWGGDNES